MIGNFSAKEGDLLGTDFLKQIEQQMPSFSKGQRAIARYLLDHYEKAAFMTASKLGATVGVSESTVVRFAAGIGCDGYPQLQKKLQDIIRNRLTSVQRIEITSEQMSRSDVVSKVLNADMDRIKQTLENVDMDSFNEAVNRIVHAKTIYILGVRSASALARFMGFYFTHIFPDVRVLNTTNSSEMFEQLIRISSDDVMICMSFPRYSQRTIKAAHFARTRGTPVISITDSPDSPLVEESDSCLFANSDMASFIDSLVAPLSLINALIVAISLEKEQEISATFAELEQIWDEYNVYEKVNDDGKNESSL